MSTASFHAKKLGKSLKAHSYGCSCGCASCGGSNEYGVAGNKVDRFPDWYWDKEPALLVDGACPAYKAAADEYQRLRRAYNKLGWTVPFTAEATQKKNLRKKAEEQEALGKEAKALCEAPTKAAEAGTTIVPAAPVMPATTVSTTQAPPADSGGGSTMLLVGIGAVVLLGGAAFVLKKKKGKKKKVLAPAPAPAALAPAPVPERSMPPVRS